MYKAVSFSDLDKCDMTESNGLPEKIKCSLKPVCSITKMAALWSEKKFLKHAQTPEGKRLS